MSKELRKLFKLYSLLLFYLPFKNKIYISQFNFQNFTLNSKK